MKGQTARTVEKTGGYRRSRKSDRRQALRGTILACTYLARFLHLRK